MKKPLPSEYVALVYASTEKLAPLVREIAWNCKTGCFTIAMGPHHQASSANQEIYLCSSVLHKFVSRGNHRDRLSRSEVE
jgi:hypothetical protein